jgi:replicative DNA helicase
MEEKFTAENVLLGAALLQDEYVLSAIKEEDFESEIHKAIFRYALYAPRGKPVDLEALSITTALPIRTLAGLSAMAHGADLESYVSELKESKLRAAGRESLRKLAALAYKPDVESSTLADALVSEGLLLLRARESRTATVSSLIEPFLSNGMRIDKHKSIASGIPSLDAITGGFGAGTLTYVGARTSMGKTTILLHFAHAAIASGKRVCIISLEMAPSVVGLKLVCVGANVSYKRLANETLPPTDYLKLESESRNEVYDNAFIESTRCTITQLRSNMRKMVARDKVEGFYVDYLTLIKPDKASPIRHVEVDQISKGLQDIAQELQVPVVCASQLNRRIATATDHTPTLADFRESGSIEEDADTCLLLHRPEYYDEFNKPGIMQVIIAKNRLYGDLGKVELEWEGGRYKPLSRFEAIKPSSVVAPKANGVWEI